MKFLMEEKDETYISKVKDDIEHGLLAPLFVYDQGQYFIRFKVVDVPKANAFIANLLKLSEQNKDAIGIDVEALHFSEDLDAVQRSHIKSRLTQLINEIDQM